MKTVEDEETKCFFLKMYANYYRNSAENKKRGGLITFTKQAEICYKEALEIILPPCNLIKLELTLSFAVFNHRSLQDTTAAIQLIEGTLKEAVLKVDDLSPE